MYLFRKVIKPNDIIIKLLYYDYFQKKVNQEVNMRVTAKKMCISGFVKTVFYLCNIYAASFIVLIEIIITLILRR